MRSWVWSICETPFQCEQVHWVFQSVSLFSLSLETASLGITWRRSKESEARKVPLPLETASLASNGQLFPSPRQCQEKKVERKHGESKNKGTKTWRIVVIIIIPSDDADF